MNDTVQPTAAVLIIGNEILSGRTRDSNLNAIAVKMASLGVRLDEARVVPDIEDAIIDALNALRARYTYVFTTGGIGPTHDDITAASVAKAFGLPLVEHAGARQRLAAYYTEANLTPARLRMALVPDGATLIDNPASMAPGFRIGNVFVMAGVPSIMQAMLDSLAGDVQHGPLLHAVTVTCSVSESQIADDLAALAAQYRTVDVGSYPSFRLGKVGLALVVRGTDMATVKACAEAIGAMVTRHGATPDYSGLED